MDYNKFLDIIWSQKPSGEDGFEGLIRKLLEQLTGQKFFLSLSGSQGGRDTASEGTAGSYIAAECKRYRPSTKLPIDDLLAKLCRAATSPCPPDIWIVVTTKRLGEQDHRILQDRSNKFGISYFSIDSEGDEISRLAALCSIAPELVCDHLRKNGSNFKDNDAEDMLNYLTVLNNNDVITSVQQQLKTMLLNDAVGYDIWALKQNKWLTACLNSKKSSLAVFAQDIAVRSTESKIVTRQKAKQALDKWWTSWQTDFKPLIILGEEGDGKSWAVADWLAEKIGQPSFPPVLFISSNLVSTLEPIDLVTDVIRKQIGEVIENYWNIRIPRWLKSYLDANPLFLIVFDGLNEYPKFNWKLLLSKLEVEPFAGRVAVLMTGRTLFWEKRINFQEDRLNKWILPPYSQDELENALCKRELSIKDFDTKLLPLLTKPRYLDLTVKLKDSLLKHGDITVERLIYEDWRDRMSRKLGKQSPLTDDEFQDIIKNLSDQWQRNGHLDRKSIHNELNYFGDGRALLDELSEARILEQDGRTWKINSNYLTLGLGLILADEVMKVSEKNAIEIDEIVATWLEPRSDMDLKVAICGMALYHALHYESYPASGALALFRAWIRGLNIQIEDWKRIHAYLPLRPDVYIKMAEYLWSEANDNSGAQNAFMAGFLRFGESDQVKKALVPAFERWMGFIHPFGHHGRYEPNDDKRQKSRDEIIRNLGSSAESGTIEKYGFQMELVKDSGLFRLAAVALAVISHQKRGPFVNAMATYALSSAVMGYPNFQTEFYWVMRTADVSIERPILEMARNLLKNTEPLAQSAAWWLLTALFTPSALDIRNDIPEKFYFKNALFKLYEEDPCANIFTWNSKIYMNCLDKTELHPTTLASRLKDVAINPILSVPEAIKNQFFRAFEGIDLNLVRCSISKEPIDFQLNECEAALCAYQPRRLACIWRLLAMVISKRVPEKLLYLSWQIYEHLLIMQEQEKIAIENAWRSSLTFDDEESRNAEMILFPCVLWGKTLKEQFDLFDERGDREGLFIGYEPHINLVMEEDFPSLETYLNNKIQGERIVCFSFLSALANSLPKINKNIRSLLLKIFNSGESHIRSMCLYIFLNTKDDVAAGHLITAEWKAQKTEDEYEKCWGSILMAESDTGLEFFDLADRISISCLGKAVKHRGCKMDEVTAYGKILDEVWSSIAGSPAEQTSDAEFTIVKTNYIEPNKELYTWWLAQDDQSNNTFRSWDSVWGGAIGAGNADDFKNAFDMDARKQRREEARHRLNELVMKENRAGNPWFGRDFSVDALDEVIKATPQYIEKWIASVLPVTEHSDNLLIRCRSFYDALLKCIINFDPEKGCELYCRLKHLKGYRIVDRITGIDSNLFNLFYAKKSESLTSLFKDEFYKCNTNESLFSLTFLFELYNRYEELLEIVESWLASEKPFDIAKGLTVFGFSDSSDVELRIDEFIDGKPESWTRNVAIIAKDLYSRNKWAKHWFSIFINHENDINAWAAFRLFLKCADRRFWLWGIKIIEDESISSFRRKHYVGNKECIRRAIEKNETDILKIKKMFLDTEIKQSLIWPWMSNYLK